MSADRASPPGRRRNPLSGDGPAVELAQALRDVVDAAGLTGKQVYTKTYIAESTQSKALGGRLVPTWPTTWGIARLDPAADETHWRRLWNAANATKTSAPAGQNSSPGPSTTALPPRPGSALLLRSLVDDVVELSGLPDWRPPRPAIATSTTTTGAPPQHRPERPSPMHRRIAGRLVALLVVVAFAGAITAFVLHIIGRPVNPALIATVPTDPSPTSVAVTPDGRLAYITTSNSSGAVSTIATTTNDTITGVGPGGRLGGITLSPDGTRAYITNQDRDVVSVLDTSNGSTITTIDVGTTPTNLEASPDGRRVYVTNYASNSLAVIDTSTNIVIATLATGVGPNSVAVSPDSRYVYISNTIEDTLSVLDNDTGIITTNRVALAPTSVAFSPDGSAAYISDVRRDAVLITDIGSREIRGTIPVGTAPAGIAVSPEGSRIYVANYTGNSLSVIANNNEAIGYTPPAVIATVPVGAGPNSADVSPDGERVYVTNSGASSVSVIDAGWLAS